MVNIFQPPLAPFTNISLSFQTLNIAFFQVTTSETFSPTSAFSIYDYYALPLFLESRAKLVFPLK